VKVMESLQQKEKRASIYKLLSDCYYLPDKKLLNLLNTLDTSKTGIYSGFTEYIPVLKDLELLVVDYSTLFVGPFKVLAPPYGSLYLEGNNRLMGDSTIDVKKWYAQESLNISLKEAPDHIAIELEFMYFLVFEEIKAIKKSDFEKANQFLKKQLSFLEKHLGQWVSDFSLKVGENAQTDFYKNLANFTGSFVKEDLNSIKRR